MSFLKQIASTYFLKYSEELSSLCFVFPNRRAGLFFRKYLAQEASKPLLAPKILTIEQLFEELSALRKADQTELIFRLYETYRDVYLLPANRDESFDNFLFWGKMMLSDFNDVDMHMVDAKRLYNNLRDIKDIEDRFSHLDNEQRESLQRFAKGFGGDIKNKYRENFLNLWSAMLPVYEHFREDLRRDGLAYEGMLSREVVSSRSLQADPQVKRYVFVGFNALSKVERELMKQLRDAGIADFCWDYSHRFLQDKNNRASMFMSENLNMFPNSIDTGEASGKLPQLTLVQVPSSIGQATLLSGILQDICAGLQAESRAEKNIQVEDMTGVGVVLPDERLLSAVRECIPACVGNINITMGQQLAETPIQSLLQQLSQLQLTVKCSSDNVYFYHKAVLALLSHPYIVSKASAEAEAIKQQMLKSNMTYVSQALFESAILSDARDGNYNIIQHIFTYHDKAENVPSWLKKLLRMLVDEQDSEADEKNEYLYQALLQVNKVERLLRLHPDIKLEVKTMFALMEGLIGSVRVPFEGEPLAGMQIMGMLESRGMDFSHLIMTDVNDETLPGNNFQQTYIPYDLRVAYGLPTPERQDAIFAYNFYRLITGADRVWLLENTTSGDMRSGEPSRYVKQLEYQYSVPIRKVSATGELSPAAGQSISIQKTDSILQQLLLRLCPDTDKGGISASALNTYVQCPVRFYLQYIKGFKQEDQITEEIQANVEGTIVHNTLQELYCTYEGNDEITAADIDNLINKVESTSLVEQQYRKEHLKSRNIPLEGIDYLNMHIIKQYVLHVLLYDKALTPFCYVASEKRCSAFVDVDDKHKVRLYGIIDRIDIKNGQLRIIDYKTGAEHLSTYNIALGEIFQEKAQKSDHVRQLLFYCKLYDSLPERIEYASMLPAIYYVSHSHNSDDFLKQISFRNTQADYEAMKGDFEEALRVVLGEILDKDIPFTARPDNKKCAYCPFKAICG